MRKRSGAIHSETQQQYLQMAQLAQNHTCIFYNHPNQKTKNQENMKNKLKEKDSKSFKYEGFQYNQQTQAIQEEKKQVKAQNGQVMGSIVIIIADNIQIIKNIFKFLQKKHQKQGQTSSQSQTQIFDISPPRKLDLVIRKPKKIIQKYWIMEKEFSRTYLAHCYLKKANFIYQIHLYNKNTLDLQYNSERQTSHILVRPNQIKDAVLSIIQKTQVKYSY